MEEAKGTIPRPGRLHTITPPPRGVGWACELAMLKVVGGDLSLEFFRMLRKLRIWAEAPAQERAGLFGATSGQVRQRLGLACSQAPELVEVFGVFAQLVRAPETIQASQLAEACHLVCQWAEERALLEVAMIFAEAAATAEPDSPARANDAGRICRRTARHEQASVWYHRGFGLGVRAKNQKETIRAQLGYGILMRELGRHAEARKFFVRAAQRAVNEGLGRQAGEAHHDLLTIAAEVGTLQEAETHFRKALEFYPLNAPQLPYLVHDFAFVLIRHRLYSFALSVLERLTPLIAGPDRILLHSSIGWAAGGARRFDRFQVAEREVLQLVGVYDEFGAGVWIHLAEGIRAFGKWDRGREYANRALQDARTRKDAAIEAEAIELIAKIEREEPGPVGEAPVDPDRLNVLFRQVDTRLRRWKAPD